MSKTYRAGNGKFVRKDNPAAVIGRLRQRQEEERRAAEQRLAEGRRHDAALHGYHGPLTRAGLAASAR